MTESGSGKGILMSSEPETAPSTDAGHPFLHFVNTVSDRGRTRDTNSFASGEDLLAQLRRAGLDVSVEVSGAAQLRGLLVLREAAYSVLSAIAGGRRPAHEDQLYIENAIKAALSDAALRINNARPCWTAGPMGGLNDHLALALDDLLRTQDLSRLRECRGCTHLFLDHGRGTGRRWCSMTRCGNRAKARGFRDRKRPQPVR
ncbi:CGNR zinc finger domain-containing protein [Roseibacterium sp. SDUM158016]|uniref:CGNR zinc finger domain-containing protein n=1 Tax=Roseicyclus sediminis TaxID=2980997 RepID=UPI0021D0D8F9|nr:CGNR zinc finger domain-containing protein [Roseibacterium sp. SDUM158016]MCU4652161.1 CGNR zinc finger domain-containing protein [Roseibacterium sp. SDUM158016]